MANEATKMVYSYLRAKDVKINYLGGDESLNVLVINWGLHNTDMMMYFFFGDDGGDVHIEGRSFITVPSEKTESMYKVCNKINSEMRWVKFIMDEEHKEIVAEDDAVIQLDSCGEEVEELMFRMASIVDGKYQDFMKALWL